MIATNDFAPAITPAQSGKTYAELYAEHFTPKENAVHGTAPAQAMPAPFKIFTLTNNSVNIVYSNCTGI
jgi:hypothetical protein